MPNRRQQRWRSYLREHVSIVLARRNVQVEHFYREEEENGERLTKLLEMLKPESFTKNNFSQSLEEIAGHLFSTKKGWTRYHLIALFAYCIKLDEICTKMHDWYSTGHLEETLVTILARIDYAPAARNTYTIFPVVCMLGVFLAYFIML